jgi:hypothetical protein
MACRLNIVRYRPFRAISSSSPGHQSSHASTLPSPQVVDVADRGHGVVLSDPVGALVAAASLPELPGRGVPLLGGTPVCVGLPTVWAVRSQKGRTKPPSAAGATGGAGAGGVGAAGIGAGAGGAALQVDATGAGC